MVVIAANVFVCSSVKRPDRVEPYIELPNTNRQIETMNKREEIASRILAGIAQSKLMQDYEQTTDRAREQQVWHAIRYTDELIKQLEETEPDDRHERLTTLKTYTGEELLTMPKGLYKVHWAENNDYSLASVGACENGDLWIAPTGWTSEELPCLVISVYESIKTATLLQLTNHG